MVASLVPWKSMMLIGQLGTSAKPSRGEAPTGATEANMSNLYG